MESNNTIDVRSFILEDKGDMQAPEETVKEQKKKKLSVIYEIVLKDNADLVVRRKTAKTSKLLVLLISQSQFYVKDERSGEIEMLTRENLKNFTTGIEERFDIGDDFWLNALYPGKQWSEDLLGELENGEKVRAIKENRHVFKGELDRAPRDAVSMWYAKEIANRMNIPLTEAVWAGEAPFYDHQWKSFPVISNIYYDIISAFGLQFGLDNAKKILSVYLDMGTDLIPTDMRTVLKVFSPESDFGYGDSTLERFKNVPKRDFRPDKFVDYFVYQLIREGFKDNAGNFWQTVADTYRMELGLYGKIKEKYPENLLTYHNQVAYLYRMKQEEIDAEKWKKAAEAEKKYEYRGKKYSIIAPEKPEDMHEEARQQCNCLASYVKRVTEQRCMIFFMRKNSGPDTSLVTIEVYPNLQLGQVKARNNREPSSECMAFVREWENKVLAPARAGIAV